MHNKSFSADAQGTIIGGRIIGDAYFDRYWHSAAAYPVEMVIAPAAHAAPSALAPLDRIRAEVVADPRKRRYLRAVKGSDFAIDLQAGRLILEWAKVQTLSDDPAKGLGPVARSDPMASELGRILRNPGTMWNWCRPTSCPARKERLPSQRWHGRACGCAS